jgi:ABC-2 type transport system ATP-binding protein
MNRVDDDGTALAAVGLGKRYRRRRGHVLRDCSFRLPAGRICALVGPNGAGKSTLLQLAAGLIRPTEGTLTVLGTSPAAARERFAYVAQGKPLPPQLTIAATLRLGAELNRARWDRQAAERIAYGQQAPQSPRDGALDPTARIRSLSGGQRTRVALALAFGKRPELMLLDEPMADLDPLARRELLGALLGEAAEHGTTIVMSSHVVAELEGVCDHLLLMGGGRIRLGGDPEELLAAHTLVTGPARDLTGHTVVESRDTGRQLTALIRPDGPLSDDWQTAAPTLEELLLAHLRNPKAPDLFTEDTEAGEEKAKTEEEETGNETGSEPGRERGERARMTTLLPSTGTSTGTSTGPSPRTGRGLARSVLRLHRSALWLWLLLVAALVGGDAVGVRPGLRRRRRRRPGAVPRRRRGLPLPRRPLAEQVRHDRGVHHARRRLPPLPRRRLGGRGPHRPRTGDRHRAPRLDPVRLPRPLARREARRARAAHHRGHGRTGPAAPPDVERRRGAALGGLVRRGRLPVERHRPARLRPVRPGRRRPGGSGPRPRAARPGRRLRRPAGRVLPGQRVPPEPVAHGHGHRGQGPEACRTRPSSSTRA